MGVESAIAGIPRIQPGTYRHYKGGIYWVPGIVSIDEESGQYRVLYWSLVKGVWWARVHSVFIEYGEWNPPTTGYEQFPDSVPSPRFKRIGGRLTWWMARLEYWLGWLKIPA